jgi:hypothetical protein
MKEVKKLYSSKTPKIFMADKTLKVILSFKITILNLT